MPAAPSTYSAAEAGPGQYCSCFSSRSSLWRAEEGGKREVPVAAITGKGRQPMSALVPTERQMHKQAIKAGILHRGRAESGGWEGGGRK